MRNLNIFRINNKYIFDIDGKGALNHSVRLSKINKMLN